MKKLLFLLPLLYCVSYAQYSINYVGPLYTANQGRGVWNQNDSLLYLWKMDKFGWQLGYYNVKYPPFNAVGDGVTDDGPAIRKAVDSAAVSGGIVFIPAGNYKIGVIPHPLNGAINVGIIAKTGVGIIGAGAGVTKLKIPNSSGDVTRAIINYHPDTGVDSNMVFRDFTLDCNGVNNTLSAGAAQFGIMLIYCINVSVRNVEVMDVRGTAGGPPGESFHFEVNGCVNVSFTNCVAEGRSYSGSGFSADGSTFVTYSDCRAYGFGTASGFTHYGAKNINHIGCYAYGNYNYGGFNSEVSGDITYTSCIAGGYSPDYSGKPTYPQNTPYSNTHGFVIESNTGSVLINNCMAVGNLVNGVNSGSGVDIIINGGVFEHNGLGGGGGYGIAMLNPSDTANLVITGSPIVNNNPSGQFNIHGLAVDTYNPGDPYLYRNRTENRVLTSDANGVGAWREYPNPKSFTLTSSGWWRFAKNPHHLSGTVRIFDILDAAIRSDIQMEISGSAYSSLSTINITRNLNYNLNRIDSVRIVADTSGGIRYACLEVKFGSLGTDSTGKISAIGDIGLLNTPLYNVSTRDSLGAAVSGKVLGGHTLDYLYGWNYVVPGKFGLIQNDTLATRAYARSNAVDQVARDSINALKSRALGNAGTRAKIIWNRGDTVIAPVLLSGATFDTSTGTLTITGGGGGGGGTLDTLRSGISIVCTRINDSVYVVSVDTTTIFQVDTTGFYLSGSGGTKKLTWDNNIKKYVLRSDSIGVVGGNTYYVHSSYSGMSSPFFSTVNAAVTAAPAGTTIMVYPGHYADGFTVATDSISIIGLGNPYYDSTTASIRGGAVIHGASSGGGKKGLRVENIGFELASAADVYTCGAQGGATINQTYKDCIFKGSGYANGYHAFINQAGMGLKMDGCSFYNSTHGIALRCSRANITNIFIQDCSGSSIIIKSDAGSGSAEDINIVNFLIRSSVANYCGAIVVQSVNASFSTKRINISNGTIYDTNPNGVTIQQTAGACQLITVSNVHVISSFSDGFKVEGGSGIMFVGCSSQSAGGYGYNNTGGTDVYNIGCFENASTSGAYSGTFSMNQLSGSYRTASGDIWDANIGFYTRGFMFMLNKLGTGWLAWAQRNTVNADARMSFRNIDTLRFADNTYQVTAAVGGGAAWGSITGTLTAQIDLRDSLANHLGWILKNIDSLTAIRSSITLIDGRTKDSLANQRTNIQKVYGIGFTNANYLWKQDGAGLAGWGQLSLSNLTDLTGNKTFDLSSYSLTFQMAAPSSPGFDINVTGNLAGDGLHVHQHTGNPTNTSRLVRIETSDADILPLSVEGTNDTIAIFIGGAIFADSIKIKGLAAFSMGGKWFDLSGTWADGKILKVAGNKFTLQDDASGGGAGGSGTLDSIWSGGTFMIIERMTDSTYRLRVDSTKWKELDTTGYTGYRGNTGAGISVNNDANSQLKIVEFIAPYKRTIAGSVATNALYRYQVLGVHTQLTVSTMTATSGNFTAYPFTLPFTVTIDTLRWEVTTAAATAGFCFGIYSNESDTVLYPSARLTQQVIYDTASTGVKIKYAGSNITLLANQVYWLAYASNSATPVVRGIPVSGMQNFLGAQATMGTNNLYTCLRVARSYDWTMPATAPASMIPVANIIMPEVLGRIIP